MISGLPLEYAQARIGAALRQRLDERAWQQTRSARTVAALLEVLRASPAAPVASSIVAHSETDEIERMLRQQLRSRIAAVAGWAPDPWRAAVLWTQRLIDLPAVVHLLTDDSVAAWLHTDPALASFARGSVGERRAALMASDLAPIARAIGASETEARGAAGSSIRIHAALQSWHEAWRRLWPPGAGTDRDALEHLERDIVRHLGRFTAAPADDTTAARAALATRAVRTVHQCSAQPAALFAYLVVAAIDLERLRGELSQRSAMAGSRAALATGALP